MEARAATWAGPLLVQSALLTLLTTWPMARSPLTQAIGSPESDTVKHLWTLWWMRAELLGGEPGQRTTLIGYPDGLPLFPIEPLHGLLSLLLPLPTVLLSNVLAGLDTLLTGLAAGWLATVLVPPPPAASVTPALRWPRLSPTLLAALGAGALLQTSAWAAFTLHVGVGELRQLWWLPLSLGALVRLQQAEAPAVVAKRAILAGLCLAGAALSCFYYGLLLGVAAVVHSALTLSVRPRRWAGLTLCAALALSIVVPVAGSFNQTYGEQGAAPPPDVGADGALRPGLTRDLLHLDDLWTPRRAERPTADRQRLAYEGGRYIGLLGLGLAAAGLLARPRAALPFAAMGAAGLLLALGPVLIIGDGAVQGASGPLRLPGGLLLDALARHASPMHFPARFAALGALAAAVLGGLAISRWRPLALVLPLAVGNVLYEDLTPWPRARTALPDLGALRALSVEGPMADLSLAATANIEHRGLLIAAQIATDRPTQAVPLERLDLRTAGGPVGGLAIVEAMRRGSGWPTSLDVDAAQLWASGFRVALLTGPDSQRGSGPRRLLEAQWGAPVEAKGAALWPIPAPR